MNSIDSNAFQASSWASKIYASNENSSSEAAFSATASTEKQSSNSLQRMADEIAARGITRATYLKEKSQEVYDYVHSQTRVSENAPTFLMSLSCRHTFQDYTLGQLMTAHLTGLDLGNISMELYWSGAAGFMGREAETIHPVQGALDEYSQILKQAFDEILEERGRTYEGDRVIVSYNEAVDIRKRLEEKLAGHSRFAEVSQVLSEVYGDKYYRDYCYGGLPKEKIEKKFMS